MDQEQKALELAKTRSHEELQTMVDNDARSVDRACNLGLLIGALVSACITPLIIHTSSAFHDPFATPEIFAVVALFSMFAFAVFLVSAVVVGMAQAAANPGFPYGVAEKAQKIKRNWDAYREWQDEQTKS